ncbi:MAG: hypothetical protein M0C28_35565 [Candidatus Moduliflexus flocculans]|nr:hypothetical protein [Candidatus Moduliflexus flocculans]
MGGAGEAAEAARMARLGDHRQAPPSREGTGTSSHRSPKMAEGMVDQ